MYRLSFLTVIILTLSFCSGCDSTLEPSDYDEEQPFVRNLEVNPSSINFDPQTDGQKDTTLLLDITVEGINFEIDSVPFYSIFINDDDSPSFQGNFPVNFSPISSYSTQIPIETNTIEFHTYTVLVTPSNQGKSSNYAQAVINQTGVPINAPEIIEVNNPSEIEIPNDGSEVIVPFTAKVRDVDGQSNIQRVLLNFRNSDGSLLSADPFELFDNGNSSSGDLIASDSVYTTTFAINNGNTPNQRTVLYWALDKSGLSSDTLETSFNLVDNE